MNDPFNIGDVVMTTLRPLAKLVMLGQVLDIRNRQTRAQLLEVNWMSRDRVWVGRETCVLYHAESELKIYCPAGELWNLK